MNVDDSRHQSHLIETAQFQMGVPIAANDSANLAAVSALSGVMHEAVMRFFEGVLE